MFLWLKQFGSALIFPHHTPPDSEDYRRLTILNTVTLSLTVGALVLIPLVPTLVTDYPQRPVYLVLTIGSIACLLNYFLGRIGYGTLASVGTVVIVTVAVSGITLALESDLPLKFLNFSSMVGFILFTRVGAWRVLWFNIAASIFVAYMLPQGSISLILDDLLLLVMLSLALLLAIAVTDRLHTTLSAQQMALVESQKRELTWIGEHERARVMNEWITNMSHDFRTPLSVMRTTLYILERNLKPEQNAARFAVLTEQIDRLTALLNYMHAAVSLKDEIKPQLKFQPITPLLHDVLARLGPLAAEKQVTLHLKLDDFLPLIALDEDGFRLALQCIVENGVLYNTPGGKVTTHCSVIERHMRLVITDTGEGIAEEDLPFIFDRFFRVDRTRSMERGRNGLGLSIAKMVIEAHQGYVTVNSVVGEGTTFSITLPLSPPRSLGLPFPPLPQGTKK